MEVIPPSQVWDNLNLLLDEINTDNKIANKIYDSDVLVPNDIWNKINVSETKVVPFQEKFQNRLLKRLAVAAVIIGLIVSAWFLFKAPSKTIEQVAQVKSNFEKENIIVPEKSKVIPQDENPDNKNGLPVYSSKFKISERSLQIK